MRVLQAKGIITDAEARAITSNASPAEQRDRLAALLRDKGVISATEFEAIRAPAASPEIKTITAEYRPSSPPRPVAPEPQPTPAVIAAVAPVRLQGIDAPKREGLIPGYQTGHWRTSQVLRHLQNKHHSRFIIAAGKRFSVAASRAGHRTKQLTGVSRARTRPATWRKFRMAGSGAKDDASPEKSNSISKVTSRASTIATSLRFDRASRLYAWPG